ncbi:MAG: hypothetical protein U5R06_16750 [candidate division KSB1 bacterium]|nr:hypothetical protein [candidate division KSB1 bacterium]
MSQQYSIPARSRQANQDLIDLTDYYTSALDEDWLGKPKRNLSFLPKGVQVFAKAAFDVRGILQLAGKSTDGNFSQSGEKIKINRKGRRLHFLHGAVGQADKNVKIGEYILHYTAGQTLHIPILYQRQIMHTWIKNDESLPTDADIAFTSETVDALASDSRVRVYKYTANNPFPGEEIESIDFVSTMTEAAPFLIALTIEPNEPVYEGFSMARIDDFCPIAPRSPEATPDMIDLSEHYTSSLDDNWFCHAGHDLRDLPQGVQMLGNTSFDIRGLVQLASSKSIDVTGVVFPEFVNNIKVDRKGRKLHFLQACFWSTETGKKIGEYIINYKNGEQRTAPIVYGKNLMDWWIKPGEGELPEAEEVWRGCNPATRSMGMLTHLLKYSWVNPLPDQEICKIDFVSDLVKAGPFLVAITLEND